MRRPRWKRRATRDDLLELSRAIDDGMDLKLSRFLKPLIRASEAPPHFVPAPLELPLAYVRGFNEGQGWTFDLGPLRRGLDRGCLRVERHGSRLLVRFQTGEGETVTTFEFWGVG